MQTEIITFYVICDNLLRAMNVRDDIQARMNTAEVMTVVLAAARFFCGNIRNASDFPDNTAMSRTCSARVARTAEYTRSANPYGKISSSFLRRYSGRIRGIYCG